jgi:tetratricopeptide (TPR) repeat protein
MLNRLTLLLLLITSTIGSSAVLAAAATPAKDPRLEKITKQELQRIAQKMPLGSSGHTKLLSRASRWNLADVAYQQYTLIWKKHPESASANLLRGLSARNYMDSLSGSLRQKNTASALEQVASLHQVTRSCLSKAVRLDPNSFTANLAQGFFLWQYDNQMPEGLSLMQKAVKIAPNDPRGHATLGEVYSNRSGNAYNPQKSEEEFKTAIRLDRSYAYPLSGLVFLYVNAERYKDAQWAMKAYLKLSPPSAKAGMQIYQTAIDAGLAKQKT